MSGNRAPLGCSKGEVFPGTVAHKLCIIFPASPVDVIICLIVHEPKWFKITWPDTVKVELF